MTTQTLSLLALALAMIAGPPCLAMDAPIQPGVYDELLIGYAPKAHTLTGYFHSETGGGQFRCILYLHGAVTGAAAAIETYFPETPRDKIAGKLVASPGGQMTITLSENPGGCAMAQPLTAGDPPASFGLEAARPWIQVRVVHARKAYFYGSPSGLARRRAYLVQGDGVGVRAASGGWLQIDYPDADKMTSGWMRAADFYPAP